MKTKHLTLKIVFSVIIFCFSMALAYFAASYVQKTGAFDYWMTLLIYAAIYIAVGITVTKVIPVSLGFLFSSSWLILHVASANFGNYSDMTKAVVTGGLLLVLYLIAYFFMADRRNLNSDEELKGFI